MATTSEQTIAVFLDDLSSRDPTPGGGSASAIVGGVGAALCGMVGRLNDKKDGGPGKLHETIEAADRLRERMKSLSDEDIAVFSQFMKTWKLPEDSDSVAQKQAATIAATESPLEIMAAAFETMHLALVGLQKSKKGCLSDAGVAAFMAHAALEGARLNVMINLPGILDEGKRAGLRLKADTLRADAQVLRAEIDRLVDAKYT